MTKLTDLEAEAKAAAQRAFQALSADAQKEFLASESWAAAHIGKAMLISLVSGFGLAIVLFGFVL